MVLTDNSYEKLLDGSDWDQQKELDETLKAIKENSLLLDQSQVEIGKLSQRNSLLSANLQQIISQSNSTNSGEIRSAIESTLDSQQRLFLMRGKLEKLQNENHHLEKYRALLERMSLESGSDEKRIGDIAPTASLEMLINAQEAERQRLSRQMHDGPAQALSNFILQAEIAIRLLDVDTAQARAELSALKTSAMGNFQKIRNFIFELRPMMLDDLGMIPTIRRYADIVKEQSGAEVSIAITGSERRLESYIEVMIFRAYQELLGNAVRHGQATLIKIQMDLTESQVKLIVDDNGKGFDSELLSSRGSLGLKIIKERIEILGGDFLVDSTPAKGTRVTLSVPIKS
jgi:two-component system sensor histidine kinase DegS